MNFVWLDINASWSHSSLALPALHANLEPGIQAACNMQVVRGTIKSSVPQIVEELAALKPAYIFATGWLFNINFLKEVLCRVSALCPPEGIFLGGPEFLGDNRDFLIANPYITAVFKGEGEAVFGQFITSLLARNGKWRTLPGFEWIETDECPCRGVAEAAGDCQRSSRVSEAVYHHSEAVTVAGFPGMEYPEKSPLFSWDKSFVQLETSRGCFNNCRFCVSGIDKAPVQNIPVGELRSRLQNIAAHGIRQVRVLDRTFNGSPRRALELLELFKEFEGKLNFHLEVHPALLFPPGEDITACGAENAPNLCNTEATEATEATQATGATAYTEETEVSTAKQPSSREETSVGKLRRALAEVPEGLLHIEAGIQTLRQEVLDGCARKGSCAQAVRGLKFLIGTGKFEVHADLIAGLPGYTYEALVEDTLQMIGIGPAEIQLESLKLLPGTHFRKNASVLGIRYSPSPPYEVLSTPHISFRQLGKAMTLSRIIDMWYNDPKWRDTFRTIFYRWKAVDAQNQTMQGITPQAGSRGALLHKLIDNLASTEILTRPLSLDSKGLLLYRFCKRHVPQQAPLVALQWVRNGLSMKKEPAESFIRWDMNGNSPANPLFIKGDPRYKYWYIDIDNIRHWFSFNKEVERVAPCNYITEKI